MPRLLTKPMLFAAMPPPNHDYYLGCPIWANAAWTGQLFTKDAPRSEWLPQYSQVFDTVEGNSTFYGLPSDRTLDRWIAEAAPGFQFALKFPRVISHERQLVHAEAETAEFLHILRRLQQAERLGPAFLQLAPTFEPRRFAVLEQYLRRLPDDVPLAVEVRHFGFYDEGPHEARLDDLLRELRMDKVLLDSRALYSAPATTDCEAISQTRKPRTPVRETVTAGRPLLRLIGRDDLARVEPWLDHWAPIVANWIRTGLRPLVFTHTPDDYFAPLLARAFHEKVRQHEPKLSALPAFPGEQQQRKQNQQRTLF